MPVLQWCRTDSYLGFAHSISCAIHVKYNNLFDAAYDQATWGGGG